MTRVDTNSYWVLLPRHYLYIYIAGAVFFLAANLINIISFFFFYLDARYGAYFNTHFLFITPRNPSAGLITAIIFKTSTSKSHCRCSYYTMSFRNWAICLVRNLISRRIFRKTPCECYYRIYSDGAVVIYMSIHIIIIILYYSAIIVLLSYYDFTATCLDVLLYGRCKKPKDECRHSVMGRILRTCVVRRHDQVLTYYYIGCIQVWRETVNESIVIIITISYHFFLSF